MKRISPAVAALLILLAAYLWASPYITVLSISNALFDRKPQALSRHVDFPALKQGLKDQSDTFVLKDPAPQAQKNLFSSLGRMIGSKVIHQIIDSVVTPEGMIALASEAAGIPERSEELNIWWRRTLAPFVRGRYGYDSLSTFSYRLPTEDGELRFLLARSGMQWRMTNVVIPPELLKRRFMKWVERR